MARISSKNQVTIPVASLHESGLRPGDPVIVEAVATGELRVRRADNDAFDEALGSLTGVYEPGYLARLDREEAER